MSIKSKSEIQVEQQIFYNMAQITEAFPQYNIVQHICHFMRRKGETKDVYFWAPELLLKKIEEYYDELKTDLVNENEED